MYICVIAKVILDYLSVLIYGFISLGLAFLASKLGMILQVNINCRQTLFGFSVNFFIWMN